MRLAGFIFLLMIDIAVSELPMNFIVIVSTIAAMVWWKWLEEESWDYSPGYLRVCRFFAVLNLLVLLYYCGYFIAGMLGFVKF